MKKIVFVLLSLIISSPIINLPTGLAAPADEVDFIVVTDDNTLAGFNNDSPNLPIFLLGIDGLESGEVIEAIDFIPGANKVLALTNLGIIRELDINTGVARSIGAIPSSLVGQSQGFDFDPANKILRLINESGQNIQIDPATGKIKDIDPAPVYAPGQPDAGEMLKIIGLAYANNNPDAASTQLFAFDKEKKALAKTDSPLAANWAVVALLDFNLDGDKDFNIDIAPDSDTALAVLKQAGDVESKLFHIDLQTGKSMELGSLGINKNITGMTLIKSFTDCLLNTARKLPLGADHTVKATISSKGQPVAGATVKFRIASGPNAGLMQAVNTNAAGEAFFLYRSNGQAGIDSILATGSTEGKNFLGANTVEWTDGPIITSVEVTGNNLTIRGFNFTGDDDVEVNGQTVKKTKFKNGFKLVAKNGRSRLFVCDPGDQPKTNNVKVFRDPVAAPPVQDTSAFATCP